MKFRVWDTKADKEVKGVVIDGDGNVYRKGLCGYEKLGKKNLRIDLLVGFDENKNPIYENDPLILEYSDGCKIDKESFVIFDGDRVWLSIFGSKTPFKEAGQKIYLKEREND